MLRLKISSVQISWFNPSYSQVYSQIISQVYQSSHFFSSIIIGKTVARILIELRIFHTCETWYHFPNIQNMLKDRKQITLNWLVSLPDYYALIMCRKTKEQFAKYLYLQNISGFSTYWVFLLICNIVCNNASVASDAVFCVCLIGNIFQFYKVASFSKEFRIMFIHLGRITLVNVVILPRHAWFSIVAKYNNLKKNIWNSKCNYDLKNQMAEQNVSKNISTDVATCKAFIRGSSVSQLGFNMLHIDKKLFSHISVFK